MMELGRPLVLAAALIALPLTASAHTWKYETDNGTTAYTDEEKNIPERYRAEAKHLDNRSIWDYGRVSIAEKGAARASAATRLEAEALVDDAAAETPPVSRNKPRLRLRVGGGASLEVGGTSDAPIVVERRQYRTNSNGIFTPHTVVTQGGKTIAIID